MSHSDGELYSAESIEAKQDGISRGRSLETELCGVGLEGTSRIGRLVGAVRRQMRFLRVASRHNRTPAREGQTVSDGEQSHVRHYESVLVHSTTSGSVSCEKEESGVVAIYENDESRSDTLSEDGTQRPTQYDKYRNFSDRIASDLFQYYSMCGNHNRRLLHDSIEINSRREGDFYEKLALIRRALDNRVGYLIAFHEDDDRQVRCSLAEQAYAGDLPIGCLEQPTFEKFITTETQSDLWIRENEIGWDMGTLEARYEIIPVPTSGHFHVLHACEWYNSGCKHLGRTLDINKRLRKVRHIDTITEQHIKHICVYLQSDGRWLTDYTSSSGCRFRFVFRSQCLQESKVSNREAGKQMEILFGEVEGSDVGSLKRSSSTEHDNRNNKRKNTRASGSGDFTTKEIVDFMMNNVSFPIDHVLQTKNWLESKFKYLIPSDKMVKRAIYLVQFQTIHFSFNDFTNHYLADDVNLIFGASSSLTYNDYYLDISSSIKVIEHLLDYQLNTMSIYSEFTPDEKKRMFIQNLYDVLEKKLPKKNSFMIVSAPSAGKNFFFDAILSYYWNTGLILNFNRYSQFPLMEAVDRRVNFWNEPNFEPNALDTIKMLLGGDPTKANVKHEKERMLMRTPVLIASNKQVFPMTDAFTDRCFFYTWQRASFLKDVPKKPCPMIWRYLVDVYVRNK